MTAAETHLTDGWVVMLLAGVAAMFLLGCAVLFLSSARLARGASERATRKKNVFARALLAAIVVVMAANLAVADRWQPYRQVVQAGDSAEKPPSTVCICPGGRVAAKQSVKWERLPEFEGGRLLQLQLVGMPQGATGGDWAVCVGLPPNLSLAERPDPWIPWGPAHKHEPDPQAKSRQPGWYCTYLYIHHAEDPFAGLPPLPITQPLKSGEYRIGVRWGEGIPDLAPQKLEEGRAAREGLSGQPATIQLSVPAAPSS